MRRPPGSPGRPRRRSGPPYDAGRVLRTGRASGEPGALPAVHAPVPVRRAHPHDRARLRRRAQRRGVLPDVRARQDRAPRAGGAAGERTAGDRHRRRLPHRPPGLRARRDRPGVRRGGPRGARRPAVGVAGAGRARARRAREAPRGRGRGRRGPGAGAAAGARRRARVRAAAGRGAGRARGHVRLPPGRPGGRGRAAHRGAVGRGVLAGPVVRGRPRPRPGGAALVPGVAHRRAGAGDRPVGRGIGAVRRGSTGHGARRGGARAGGRHGAGVGGRGAGVRVAPPRSGRGAAPVRGPPALAERVRANWEAAAAAHTGATPAATA